MDNNNTNSRMDENVEYPEQEDIFDLKALFLRLWDKRKFILQITVCFVALGLLAAIFQKPVYKAECVFVPLSSSSRSNSQMSSLAAIAGMNLGDMSTGSSLSPLIYPQLMGNIDLNKELMRVPIHFKGIDEPLSLYDKATDPRYKTFNLLATVKKYTIGLPKTIMSAIRGSRDTVAVPEVDGGMSIPYYYREERGLARKLASKVKVDVSKKDGYLTLSTEMDEPVASAELCQASFDLLQKYVADFKLKQAQEKYDYIQSQYEAAKADYEEKQLTLARFTDSNRGLLNATTQIERDRLSAAYNIALSMFNEMSKQKLQVEMKIKEDVPVLSPVKPVCVPQRPSNSRSKTFFIWAFLGFFVACGSVLAIDWLRTQGLNWPKKWK